MRISWNAYFMAIAKVVSTRSTCNSRHNGCVIVKDKQILSTGYNGSMPGRIHCCDLGDEYCERRVLGVSDIDKYNYCVAAHAESNAVSLAAKNGISLIGSTAYCSLFPCYNCLKSMVVAGVVRIIYEYRYESCDKERDKFWEEEAKVVSIEELVIDICDVAIIKNCLEFPTSGRVLPATE